MDVDPIPTRAFPPPSTAYRRLAVIFDFWLLIGFSSLFTVIFAARPAWSFALHAALPLLVLPVFLFLGHRIIGKTPGQALFGFQYRLSNGSRALRLYDWLFSLSAQTERPPSPHRFARLPAIGAALVFTVGASLMLWRNDPTVRPFPSISIPLSAPSATPTTTWQVLPFFYATGTFPIRLLSETPDSDPKKQTELSVEFSLPYEKGPPNRFLGKITAYWRALDSRLTLTGPLTLSSPSHPNDLRVCFSQWLRCLSDRRKIWMNSVKPLFGDRPLREYAWFATENPFVDNAERPQGLYIRSAEDRGRIREAYFLVGPKMAVQALVLDRPDRSEGDLASETLRKIVGSLRMSDDLQAPRAFINPKLAALRIGPKSSLADLIAAEGYLLAKVSIEPKEAESFYHLGGLALTLFHAAKREGRIELAASSKSIVKSALRFARDVDPNSKRVPEMERFEAEVEAP